MSYTLTFVRVTIGLIMFVHGLAAAFGLFGGRDSQSSNDMALYVNMSPGVLVHLVSWGMLLTGLSLILGLFAKPSALIVLALIVVHTLASGRYRAFFVRDNGIEFLLAGAALCCVVATYGPGPLCMKLPKGKGKK